MKLLDKLVDFHDPVGNDGKLMVEHKQEIPADWVSDLKRDKIDADHNRSGEFMRLAAIPVVFYEQFQREGYDIMKMTPREIINFLKSRGLDAFITTNKSV